MMKFFFMMMMMMCMVGVNQFMMFYYNLVGLMGVMFIMECMFKGYSISMNFYLSIDYYSYLMVMLMFWVIMLMMMSLGSKDKNQNIMFMIMMMILFMYFISNSMLMFYFYFELSLIPIYFIIVYWGYNIERVKASYYLLMYTMMISLPLLIYILFTYSEIKILDLSFLILMGLKGEVWGLIIMLGPFLVKLPMFMFHYWLGKAHVEAPVYGSMILAAVLLKMGGYGLMRMMMIFMKDGNMIINVIISISIIGSFLISLVCMVQIDMKLIVAYSSVVHMNIMLSSMMSMYKMGLYGSYIMMISHGLYSSGLFFMVNMFFNRSLSRLLVLNKGMNNVMSSLMIMWFMLSVLNFSFPFSMVFMSEIYLISVLLILDKSLMIYLILVMFFSSAYSLYMYSYIGHGMGVHWFKKDSGSLKESMIIIMHLYPLMFMLFNMNLF